MHSSKLLTKYEKNLHKNFPLFSLVSLTPLINIDSRISPRIFEKIRNGPNGTLKARGTLIYEKNLKLKISGQTPVKSFRYFLPSFVICGRNYRPSFRENKPKTLVFYDWKRAFWACFCEYWVYKFGHCTLPCCPSSLLTGSTLSPFPV